MKVDIVKKASGDLQIVLIDSCKAILGVDAVPETLQRMVKPLIEDTTFQAKRGTYQRLAVRDVDNFPLHVAVFSVGKMDAHCPSDWMEMGGSLYESFKDVGNETAAIFGLGGSEILSVARGMRLAAYRYDAFKTKRTLEDGPKLTSAILVSDKADSLAEELSNIDASVDGTYFCRDLVNAPPSHLYPESFAEQLDTLSEHGVQVTRFNESALEELGMKSMLGVGQGSERDSFMVQMKWMGGAAGADPVILVGKGVCFDAGGISLKPGLNMQAMRGDMGGAAAVSGAMLALAKAGVKANVLGLVGLVENMPDGNAIRPGDILHSASGQTIEVQNTDAEGRLVLCDVLWYAQQHFKPRAIVDLATLTGAIVISLGHEYAGLFSNDDTLAAELSKSGEISGEQVWRFPLARRYDALLKSKFADMRNIGGRAAGSITAAQFLARFVNEGVRWAHLDIAGVAWVEGAKKATDPSWASGFGPALLLDWIRRNYAD